MSFPYTILSTDKNVISTCMLKQGNLNKLQLLHLPVSIQYVKYKWKAFNKIWCGRNDIIENVYVISETCKTVV
jgi:hypothetical protein